ncbi:MAG: nucleoside phosphorylase [bacterium]|nr:nucleoside phosphorylase [bacterium]MDE0289057.1 nucleoside phosphorylase [bacterium]MDE0439363.1 nucleoside phosphorylase [bacterium]
MGAFDKSAIDKDARQYATRIRKGDVARYVLLPGDPARVDRIGTHLDDVTPVADSREFRTITGSYKGIPVSATSTGVGCPSASIAVEELTNAGATHFIRVGSTAALQPHIRTGDIVINTGVVRNDGTTRAYVPDTYPAIADHFLVHALIETARDLRSEAGFDLHIGLGACDDAFYAETPEWIERHSRLGLLNIEMESSAIFTVAQLRGVHAAMVCGVSGSLVVADFDYDRGEHGNQRLVAAWENAIAIALEAVLRYDTEYSAPLLA